MKVNAAKLDLLTKADDEASKLAELITQENENSKKATLKLLQKLAQIINSPKSTVEAKQIAQIVNTNLIEYYGYISLKKLYKAEC